MTRRKYHRPTPLVDLTRVAAILKERPDLGGEALLGPVTLDLTAAAA